MTAAILAASGFAAYLAFVWWTIKPGPHDNETFSEAQARNLKSVADWREGERVREANPNG